MNLVNPDGGPGYGGGMLPVLPEQQPPRNPYQEQLSPIIALLQRLGLHSEQAPPSGPFGGGGFGHHAGPIPISPPGGHGGFPIHGFGPGGGVTYPGGSGSVPGFGANPEALWHLLQSANPGGPEMLRGANPGGPELQQMHPSHRLALQKILRVVARRQSNPRSAPPFRAE